MKVLKISNTYFDTFPPDKYELLSNESGGKQRPYVVILTLKYKNALRIFAIPFRSNISNKVPLFDYFPLPPRPTTKQYHKHGLHYTKMFPVKKGYFQKYHINDKDNYTLILMGYIGTNEVEIVEKAQAYLDRYEKGDRSEFASKIDEIISILDEIM